MSNIRRLLLIILIAVMAIVTVSAQDETENQNRVYPVEIQVTDEEEMCVLVENWIGNRDDGFDIQYQIWVGGENLFTFEINQMVLGNNCNEQYSLVHNYRTSNINKVDWVTGESQIIFDAEAEEMWIQEFFTDYSTGNLLVDYQVPVFGQDDRAYDFGTIVITTDGEIIEIEKTHPYIFRFSEGLVYTYVGYYDEYAISDLLHNIIAEGDFSEFSYPNSIFATSKRATEITLNNYQIVDNYVAGWGSRNGQTEGEFFIYRIDPESNLVDAATVPNPPRSYLGVFYEFGQTFLVWENYLFAVVVDQIMVINMDVAVDRPDDAEFRDFTDFYIGG